MKASLPLTSLLFALVLCAGCDRAGVHPLGSVRDALVPCDIDPLGRFETTSTWVRSTAEGTEIFLLGSPEATAVVPTEAAKCFGHGFVAHDSSTRFEFGSYTLGADGKGTAVTTVTFSFVFEPMKGILSRDGSQRIPLRTPLSHPLIIKSEGTKILVTYDATTARLTELGELIESLDPTTQQGAEDIFRVYNLPLFTSQARLLGFGSGAMTQYVGPAAQFNGAIRNRFTVKVNALLKPDTDIIYYQFEDLTGIVIDGVQQTKVNTKGNGSMVGILNFVMRGTGGASDVQLRGHLDYGKLIIGDGFASAGTYELSIDGVASKYTISYMLATDIDLRHVLPVETP